MTIIQRVLWLCSDKKAFFYAVDISQSKSVKTKKTRLYLAFQKQSLNCSQTLLASSALQTPPKKKKKSKIYPHIKHNSKKDKKKAFLQLIIVIDVHTLFCFFFLTTHKKAERKRERSDFVFVLLYCTVHTHTSQLQLSIYKCTFLKGLKKPNTVLAFKEDKSFSKS